MKHLKSPIATGFSSGHKEFSNKCTFCLDEMLPKGYNDVGQRKYHNNKMRYFLCPT